jgi:hypothetical protein
MGKSGLSALLLFILFTEANARVPQMPLPLSERKLRLRPVVARQPGAGRRSGFSGVG